MVEGARLPVGRWKEEDVAIHDPGKTYEDNQEKSYETK